MPADHSHLSFIYFWLESVLPHYHSITILNSQSLLPIPLSYLNKEAILETNFVHPKLARMQSALEFARSIWARRILVIFQFFFSYI